MLWAKSDVFDLKNILRDPSLDIKMSDLAHITQRGDDLGGPWASTSTVGALSARAKSDPAIGLSPQHSKNRRFTRLTASRT